jgi:hypothetical protein
MPANFKTACDLRARLAGFDSQAVPPIFSVYLSVLPVF